jgi:hypothetical protein
LTGMNFEVNSRQTEDESLYYLVVSIQALYVFGMALGFFCFAILHGLRSHRSRSIFSDTSILVMSLLVLAHVYTDSRVLSIILKRDVLIRTNIQDFTEAFLVLGTWMSFTGSRVKTRGFLLVWWTHYSVLFLATRDAKFKVFPATSKRTLKRKLNCFLLLLLSGFLR